MKTAGWGCGLRAVNGGTVGRRVVEGGGVIMDWTMDLGHRRVGGRQLQEHIRR